MIINKYVGVATTDAFSNPLLEAQHSSFSARSLGFDTLVMEHRQGWEDLWMSADIEIPGDKEIQLSVRSSMFHLWTNVRNGNEGRGIGDTSIAPAGLTSDSYAGQVRILGDNSDDRFTGMQILLCIQVSWF
jgi:trehalose/maltose hydrolase-like predicted phosphorylase